MRRTRVVLAGLAAGVLAAGGGVAASGAASSNGSASAAAGTASGTPVSSSEFWENYNRSLQETAKDAGPAPKPKRRVRADLLPSAKAHRGRGTTGEARKLVRSIAPQLVSDGAVVPKPSDVDEVLSPTLVQMKGKNGRSGGVMTSNLPMGTANGSKNGAPTYDLADIAWTTVGDRFEVKDPVVPVSLPEQAGGTVDIGKDISLRLADPGTTAKGSPDGEAVTYPSISTDTDMVVRSLPTGVQVGWLLRSPAADQEFRLPVNLKDGETLRRSPNGSVQLLGADDMVVGEVATVTAADADHVAVPLTTTVKNDTIVYAVDHVAGEVKYPIVVDPQIADVHWDTGADTTQNTADGWFGQNTPRPNEPYSYGRNPKNGSQRGQLSILGNQQAGYSQTAAAAWGRYSPGDQSVGGSQNAAGRRLSTEHGYWYRFDAGGLAYSVYPNKNEHYYNYPQSVVAFTDRNGNTDTRAKWAFLDANGNPGASNAGVMFGKLPNGTTNQSAAIWLGDSAGDNARLGNGQSSSDNLMLFGLSPIPPYYYWQYEHPFSAIGMGWYKAYASDVAPPKVAPTAASTPSGAWQDTRPATVSFSASDAGLGVKAVRLETTSSTVALPTALAATQNNACDRPDANTFCRFTQTGTFDGSAIPEGRGTARLVAVDGDDLDSTQTFVPASGSTAASYQSNPATGALNYAIDTTDPDLTLSGDLFTQRDTTIPVGQTRSLSVNAADGVPGGTPAQQQSGVQRVEIYVDDQLVKTETQTQAGDSRGLSTTWTAPAGYFAAGDYKVVVVTTDKVGHTKQAAFTVHAPCCAATPGTSTGASNGRLTTVEDADGDGRSDLILVSPTTGDVSVRLGGINGSFGAESAWGSAGTDIRKVAAGDITGDGKSDLAVQTNGGALRTAFSDGTTFSTTPVAPLRNPETSWPVSRTLALADLDGDGMADIVGADSSSGNLVLSSGSEVGVTGAQTITPAPTMTASQSIVFGDFTGDGSTDLAIYDRIDGTVRVRPLTPDDTTDEITFGPEQAWGTGPSGASVAAADVDGNGQDDMLFRTDSGSGNVVAKTSTPSGQFSSTTRSFGDLDPTYTLLADDLTADGKDDAIGTRVSMGSLETRSLASNVPDDTPNDPDTTSSARSAAKVSAAPAAEVMAQDDSALLWADPSVGGTDSDRVRQILRKLKYLGVTRIRFIVPWGAADRLHPKATVTAGPDNTATLTSYPRAGAAVAYRTAAAGQAWPDTEPDPGENNRDPSAQTATGRKVSDRWIWGPYDALIAATAAEGIKVHITLTGGTPASYLECPRQMDEALRNLMPRGCVGVFNNDGPAPTPQNPNSKRLNDPDVYRPTGWNPDPKAYGHFVFEATRHFRAIGGATVASVGLWNEPNFTTAGATSSRYMAVTATEPGYTVAGQTTPLLRIKPDSGIGGLPGIIDPSGNLWAQQNLNSATRYGQVYAAGYWGTKAADPNVAVVFGETAPSDNQFASNTTKPSAKQTADKYLKTALQSARNAWRSTANTRGLIASAGFAPIVDRFGIHPYQHKTRPWAPGGNEVFGVYGVGRSGRKGSLALVDYLASFAGQGLIANSPVATSAGTGAAPRVWATEFGYYNYNGSQLSPVKRKTGKAGGQTPKGSAVPLAIHGEQERALWMAGGNVDSSPQLGAFEQLRVRGGADLVMLYNVLERAPSYLADGDDPAKIGRPDDLGIIGSAASVQMTRPPGSSSATSPYSGQFLAASGNRPYGLGYEAAPNGGFRYTLDRPNTPRRVACTVRGWAAAHGTTDTKQALSTAAGGSGC